jgi:hypothetical protein
MQYSLAMISRKYVEPDKIFYWRNHVMASAAMLSKIFPVNDNNKSIQP